MSGGEPVAASVGGAGLGDAAEAQQAKNARTRNWAPEEVLVACMAASRTNTEQGESPITVRGPAMARLFEEYAMQLEKQDEWHVFRTDGLGHRGTKVPVSPASAAEERNTWMRHTGDPGARDRDTQVRRKPLPSWQRAQLAPPLPQS